MIFFDKPVDTQFYEFNWDTGVKDFLKIDSERFSPDRFIIAKEFTFNHLRFDLLVYDFKRDLFHIREYKSGYQDFISDKKWTRYLGYCNTFTLVFPHYEIFPNLVLPDKVGVECVFSWENKTDGIGGRRGLSHFILRRPESFYMDEDLKKEMTMALLKKLARDKRIKTIRK